MAKTEKTMPKKDKDKKAMTKKIQKGKFLKAMTKKAKAKKAEKATKKTVTRRYIDGIWYDRAKDEYWFPMERDWRIYRYAGGIWKWKKAWYSTL
eukprot:NODE_3346_length_798_cov_3.952894.p3 GENE.NODE_3346_length_798_cov_3.952894~~NODE_3346_length_798_cov_3.952894.p3  ORF type:complete len:94 (+),score=43.04 NODE_3346_length_798_cov_3.952894:239-520(+)